MKIIRRLIVIFFVGAVAALGVIFWPKIREHCDRWLACAGDDECGDGDIVEIIDETESE